MDEQLPDAVTITPKGTRGNDGRYTYDGSAVTTIARVIHKSGVRRHGTDTEWKYEFIVIFKADETIALQDQVTFEALKHQVRELERVRDVGGTLHYYRAYCG